MFREIPTFVKSKTLDEVNSLAVAKANSSLKRKSSDSRECKEGEKTSFHWENIDVAAVKQSLSHLQIQ